MQRTIKTFGAILLVAASLGVFGCGENELLDEEGQRYRGSFTVSDADEDGVLTIDTVPTICSETVDPDTGAVTVEIEPYTDALAEVSIAIATGAPGITLESYSISYTALGSADSSGNIVRPPNLVNPPRGYYSIDIQSGGSATFPLTLLTVDTKDEFAIGMGWLQNIGGDWVYILPPDPDELQVGRYRITLDLHFVDQYGVERDITLKKTVYLSNYDNC